MAKKDRLVLIDGSAVFFRGYFALPPLSNAEGVPTNATLGYSTMLLKVLTDLKPKYCIVTWDKSGDTFRKDIYPEYKATRKKQPDDLYAQMPYARQVTEALGLPFIELANYEADDIIGTLAAKAERRGLETMIVTGDRDEFQLIDENTKVYIMRRGFSDIAIYDKAALQERYGVTPRQFIDLKALMGDSSDNIPGIEGVGEKTAMNLITTYGTLDGIYEHVEEIRGKLGERIRSSKEVAYLSRQLSEIVCDAPVELELEPATVGTYDRAAVHELFRRLEFKNLLNRLPAELQKAPNLFDDGVTVEPQREHLKEAQYHTITNTEQLDALAAELKSSTVFTFDTETTGINDMTAELVGISVAMQAKEAYYIPVAHLQGEQLSLDDVRMALAPIFADPAIGKVGHNAKYDYKILARNGMTPCPITFDTMIAAFLLNPLGRSQSLDDLAYKEFGIEMIPISELIGTGKSQTTFDHIDIETATTYAAEDSDITWRLYEKMKPRLDESTMRELAYENEFPLIEVLGDMEIAGIELDVPFLAKFSKRISADLETLIGKIYEQAGDQFNIGSPAQLAVVLFEKLGLPTAGVKKGKTGYSTAATELEKLHHAHPIVPLIGEYRELTKLKNTYVETLPLQVDEASRLHTNYSQTIVPSGRLSSNNPNLQNIPVRTELGREIRKAFIVPVGRILVSADYSQIELRVAAALSKDPGMIETFENGVDLHQQTAAEMFAVPLEEVTKEQRYAAKTVNFGVLYGMSPHGLSIATGMARDEAAAFIERYFEVRGTLKSYIEKLKADAHKNEYVETLLGRRWPCPEINSSNFMMRSGAERVATNIPIQGTAAEIMKLAMIAVAEKLYGTPTKMLLQIHDQLILEADEGDVKAVTTLLKDTMENVYDLGVPIVADTSTGRSWGDL